MSLPKGCNMDRIPMRVLGEYLNQIKNQLGEDEYVAKFIENQICLVLEGVRDGRLHDITLTCLVAQLDFPIIDGRMCVIDRARGR